VDPNAKVLIGGLLLDCDPIAYPGFCFASNFLNGILAAGGGPYFDGIGFNSYDYYLDSLGSYSNLNWFSSWNDTGPVIAAKADFLRSVLSSHSVTGKFLIGLESGLLCDTSWGHTCESDFETTKAYYLAKAYAMTIGENVIGNNWYGHEFSFQTATTRNSALLDNNRDPLPAYFTYQFASGFLNGATTDSDYSGDPNVKGYVFDRGGTTVWVIWSKDGATHGITLPGTPNVVYEIGSDGKPNSLTPSTSLNVTRAPVFIEY
jgi:hypothetical protein